MALFRGMKAWIIIINNHMSSQKVESNSFELQNQRQLEISGESSSLTNKVSFSNQNYSKNEKKQNIDKKSSVSVDHLSNGK